jgi:hypothetical protein
VPRANYCVQFLAKFYKQKNPVSKGGLGPLMGTVVAAELTAETYGEDKGWVLLVSA